MSLLLLEVLVIDDVMSQPDRDEPRMVPAVITWWERPSHDHSNFVLGAMPRIVDDLVDA